MGRKRSSRRSTNSNVSRTPPTEVSRGAVWGPRLIEAGVIAGVMLVPAAMYTVGRSPFGPPKMTMLAFAAVLVLLGLVLDRDARGEVYGVAMSSQIAWAAAAILGIALLATFTSIDPRQSFLGSYPDYRGLMTILACVVVGFGGVVVARREDARRRFWRALVAVSIGIIGFGVLQRSGAFPTGPQGYFKTGSRISSTLGNSSNYGVYLVLFIPLLVRQAVVERSAVWRWLAGGSAAFGIIGLLWALSRGAWVAAIVVVALWPVLTLWAGRNRALVTRIGIGLAIAIVLAGAGAAITPGFAKRAANIVDVSSRTAKWRVSAWRSSWEMTLDRPFLGHGPNVFRFAYPRYQAPNQISGKGGYRVVESAHNVFLDTSTSFGLPGLAILGVLFVLVGTAAMRSLADERDGLGIGPTAFVALFGGLVAVQFHYVTMDTGPVMAVLTAFIASGEAQRRQTEADTLPAYVTPALAAGAALFAVATFAGVGLMAADIAASNGAAAAKANVPWAVARAELRRAAALAPWEPQMRRAEGTAATVRVVQRNESAPLDDGVAAFDDVMRVTPLDLIVAAERANLLLAVGIKTEDRALIQRAAEGFEYVAERDPNTGIPRAGMATSLLALGRTEEAIAEFEVALERSPRDQTALSNLARAYERVGRVEDATQVRKRIEN